MKKVYIDISMVLIGTSFTGVPRVVMEVSRRLYEDKELELVFMEYCQKRDCFERIESEGFIQFCTTRKGDRNKLRTGKYFSISDMNQGDAMLDIDTVWKTRTRRSFLYKEMKKQGVKIIPFVHDIIGVTHPQFCPMYDMLSFMDFTGAILAYADEIIVTTHTTENEILNLATRLEVPCPPIHITPLGGNFARKQNTTASEESGSASEESGSASGKNDSASEDADVSESIKKAADSGKYLLMVGTIEPRKNHKLLLDAYEKGLKDLGFQLIFAGFRGWNNDAFFERLENHPDYGRGIWHINGATDQEIGYLYEHCFALAFPSYVEGYGLPIVEAYSKGVLVLAADTPINMEIAKEKGIYFKQDNPEDLVEKVSELLKHPEEYQAKKENLAVFVPPTWDETAKGIGNILKL